MGKDLAVSVRSVIALASMAFAGSAFACSVIIVGKDASATGRVLVGHNEDDRGELFVRHGIVPARDHAAGETLPAEDGCAAVSQVAHTVGFYWTEVKSPEGGPSAADAFYNENGVLVVSDNAAPVWFEDAWTDCTDGGIYYNLRRAIAERATSARDAVTVATNLLMRYGYVAPGRIYTVADRDEAWTIQVLRGRHFVARRCPDDGVVAVPNCLTIGRIEKDDVVSPCIAERIAKDPAFDYARAFQGAARWRDAEDTLRWKHMFRLAAGVDVGETYPFSVKPARKVSPDDLKKALSTHYEGTPDEVKPKHGADLKALYHPVCRESTIESLVCEFAAMPAETELQVAMGSPCENPYLAFRPFQGGIPAAYDRSADAVGRLESHCRTMCREEFLAEIGRPSPKDGIGRFALTYNPAVMFYNAPHAIEKGSDCEVAVILVHGWGNGVLTGEDTAPLMEALKAATPSGKTPPYVIAPLYPRREMLVRPAYRAGDRAIWNDSWGRDLTVPGKAGDDWRGGGDAAGTKFSSFDAIDRIFAVFGDVRKYPKLRRVVLTGFSAGGQFVDRYVAVGKGVVRDGVEIRYAAMAPSTILRFDPGTPWHYGLKDRPRYSAGLTDAQILRNLTSRKVFRVCGTRDVKVFPFCSLDSCLPAMLQGRNRYERFCNYRTYLADNCPEWAAQNIFHEIDGSGHDSVFAHTEKPFIDYVLGGL